MSEEQIYRENILDHNRNPHNKGTINNPTIQHREHNPLCGDDITIYLIIEDDKIKEAKFNGHGCAISQASISMLTEELKGMPITEAKLLTKEDILEMLGIEISYTRMRCALLSLKVLQEGLQ